MNSKVIAIVATALFVGPVLAGGSAKAAVIDWTAWSNT